MASEKRLALLWCGDRGLVLFDVVLRLRGSASAFVERVGIGICRFDKRGRDFKKVITMLLLFLMTTFLPG